MTTSVPNWQPTDVNMIPLESTSLTMLTQEFAISEEGDGQYVGTVMNGPQESPMPLNINPGATLAPILAALAASVGTNTKLRGHQATPAKSSYQAGPQFQPFIIHEFIGD